MWRVPPHFFSNLCPSDFRWHPQSGVFHQYGRPRRGPPPPLAAAAAAAAEAWPRRRRGQPTPLCDSTPSLAVDSLEGEEPEAQLWSLRRAPPGECGIVFLRRRSSADLCLRRRSSSPSSSLTACPWQMTPVSNTTCSRLSSSSSSSSSRGPSSETKVCR